MRPRTLREVSDRAASAPDSFADACHEFADAFYLNHGDLPAQQAMLDVAPEPTGDAFRDAWMACVAEHLAQRWGLAVPAWVGRPEFGRLDRPVFVPDSPELRGYLLVASPPAFRSRLIFTGDEPLQRARFPRGVREIRVAIPWPGKRPA